MRVRLSDSLVQLHDFVSPPLESAGLDMWLTTPTPPLEPVAGPSRPQTTSGDAVDLERMSRADLEKLQMVDEGPFGPRSPRRLSSALLEMENETGLAPEHAWDSVVSLISMAVG